MLAEKLVKAEDGRILLDNDDMQKIIEAVKEQEEEQMVAKSGVGVNCNPGEDTVRKIRFPVLYILKLYDKIGKILRLMH